MNVIGGQATRIFFKATSVSFFLKIAGQFSFLLMHILLARTLDTRGYGEFVYVLALINVLVIPAKMGFDTSMMRYVASYQSEDGKKAKVLLKSIIYAGTLIVLLVSTIVGMIFFFTTFFLLSPDTLRISNNGTLWTCMLLPILSVYAVNQQALVGARLTAIGLFPEEILRPLIVSTVLLISLLLSSTSISSTDAIAILAFSSLVACIYTMTMVHVKILKKIPKSTPFLLDFGQLSSWLKTSIPLLLVSGIFLLLNRLDVIMLSLLSNPESTGMYSAATRIATIASFGLTVIQVITGPLIARYYTENNMVALQNSVLQAARFASYFAIPVFIILLLAGEFLLSIFGVNFVSAYWALIILAIAQVLNAFTGPSGHMLSMTNGQNLLALILLIGLILNLVLNYFFIPIWDINGAAIATSISMVTWNGLAAALVWKKYSIRCTPF